MGKKVGLTFGGRGEWVDLDYLVRSQEVDISAAAINTTRFLWSASDFSGFFKSKNMLNYIKHTLLFCFFPDGVGTRHCCDC